MNTGDTTARIESQMLLEERDYWRQRALQAEQMTQALQKEKPLDVQSMSVLIATHVNENSTFQAESYRKALLYVRDITGVIASGSEPSADIINVMRRLNANISITLSRFGDDGLKK